MAKKNKENMSLEMAELKKRYGDEIVRVVEGSVVKRVLKKTWTPVNEAVFVVQQKNGGILTTPLISTLNLNMEDKLRYEAELDPNWKQIVGYCVIRKGRNYFVTHRLNKTGEQRLIGAYSLGTGGHATTCERVGDSIRRELEEEVGLTDDMIIGKQLVGYILSEDTAVNAVHLGLVYEVVVNTDDVHCLETEKLAGEWMPVENVRKLYEEDELESWSRYVVENMIGVGANGEGKTKA